MAFPVPILGWPVSGVGGVEIPGIGGAELFESPWKFGVEKMSTSSSAMQNVQTPVVGEVWSIEAVIYSLAIEYTALQYTEIQPEYEKLTGANTSLEEQLTNLGGKQVRLEEQVVNLYPDAYNAVTTQINHLEANLVLSTEAQSNAKEIYEKEATKPNYVAYLEAAKNVNSLKAEIEQYLAERVRILGEAHNVQSQTEETLAQKHQVNREKALLEKEISELGVKEATETLNEAIAASLVTVQAQLSFNTYPFYISQLTRQQQIVTVIKASTVETIEGVRFILREVSVREYFFGRDDLTNAPSQVQGQTVTAGLSFYVPLRKIPTFEPKTYPGPPYVKKLKVAVQTFTLQCGQTSSLANQRNPA